VVGLLALVNSTIINTSRPRSLVFHIITTSEKLRKSIVAILTSKFPTLRYDIQILEEDARNKIRRVWGKYRSSSLIKPIVYIRYFLQKLLPGIDRLIYLDQDTLVIGKIPN
jgi:lipopolysaccharide biosynthesis glycosyltransferase